MRIRIFIAVAFIAVNAVAQSSYTASMLLNSDLTGTARYVGMGGSMNALGADISVMGTNPAGIGLYRSGDVSVSLSLGSLETEADYLGSGYNEKKTRFSLDNAGAVLSNPVNFNSVKFVNVGFSYKRRNNLKREFSMAGALDGFSQMYQMQRLYDAAPFDIANMSYNDYTSLNYSWLALLAADGGLLDPWSDPQGELVFPSPTSMVYHAEEKGGVDQIDYNVSCNIDDRFYLGVTLGIYNVDYERNSYYGEDDVVGPIYTIYNRYATEGSGFDLKLGAIIRPFEGSPFRFGVAVHTPTWYSLTDIMSSEIYGVDFEGSPYGGYMSTLDYEYAYGDNFYVDYRLTTPWRFNFSTAYTFGNSLALNAEYEYSDYSSASMKYSGGHSMTAMNEEIKSNMKEVHTFKVGAELKIADNVSLRGGYNYLSAPFNKDAAKVMIPITDTNTEYLNSLEQQNYTLGVGFRSGKFYIDAAFVLSEREAEFYPFYDRFTDDNGRTVNNYGASVKDTDTRLVVTAGTRF